MAAPVSNRVMVGSGDNGKESALVEIFPRR